MALDAGETSWEYDAERLIAAVTPQTKLIVLCTPNNPTGNAMALADVRRIADLGVPLLIDAAYSDFDPTVDLMGLVHDYPHLIITRTFSKAYCLAGLRVGYGVMHPHVLDYVDRFLVPGSAVSSAALHAGLAALHDEAYHDHQVQRISAERDRLTGALRELGYRTWESKGNFVSVDGAPARRRRRRAGRRDPGARRRGAAVRRHRADQRRHRARRTTSCCPRWRRSPPAG